MLMNTKEQLLYFFLQGKISLSQYDYKFLSNLQMMIQRDKRVTSNQAVLFDKLISKYKRQFDKSELRQSEMFALPWDSMIVESTSEYTGAVVTIDGDDITLRVPFNKTFITKFRDIPNNTFQWIKEEKLYRSPFNTTAFKLAVTRLDKFFPTVQYCANSNLLINELSRYSTNDIWNPTVVEVNGRLMIAACNEFLWEKVKDIELKVEPKTLFQLSKYGITAEKKLIENDEALKFAAQKISSAELADTDYLLRMLKSIECSVVFFGRGLTYSSVGKELQRVIAENGFTATGGSFSRAIESTDNAVYICVATDSHLSSINSMGACKVVVLKDSRHIEVK